MLDVIVPHFFFSTFSVPPRCKYFDFKAPHSWGFLFAGGWVDLNMHRYLPLLLFIGLAYSQETEKKDSKFALLKSGEIKQVQKTYAYIEFGTPLVMNFEITDTDSVKYDIYDIKSIHDSKRKTIMGEKSIFLMKFVQSIFHTLVLVGFIWIIIY